MPRLTLAQQKRAIKTYIEARGRNNKGISLRKLRRYLEHKFKFPEYELDGQKAEISRLAQEIYNAQADKWSSQRFRLRASPRTHHHPGSTPSTRTNQQGVSVSAAAAAANSHESDESSFANGGEAHISGSDAQLDHSGVRDEFVDLAELKQPLSAYVMFAKDFRVPIKEASPGISFGDLAKKLSQMWRACDEETRQKYVNRNKALRRAYNAEKARRNREAALRNRTSKLGTSIRRQLGAPKKPMTAYFLFCREHRERVVTRAKVGQRDCGSLYEYSASRRVS